MEQYERKIYFSDAWIGFAGYEDDRKKVNVFTMKCLRSMTRKARSNGIKNYNKLENGSEDR